VKDEVGGGQEGEENLEKKMSIYSRSEMEKRAEG
jgi:hypothetical protein